MELPWSGSNSDSDQTVTETRSENPVVNTGYRRCPECGSEKLYVTEDASAICDYCGQAFMDVREESQEFGSDMSENTPPPREADQNTQKEIPPPPEDYDPSTEDGYEDNTRNGENTDYRTCPSCEEENLYVTSDGSGFCDECGFSTLEPEGLDGEPTEEKEDEGTEANEAPPNDETPPPPPEPDIPGPSPTGQEGERDTDELVFESSRYERCPNCDGDEFYIETDGSAFCDNCGYASMDVREEMDMADQIRREHEESTGETLVSEENKRTRHKGQVKERESPTSSMDEESLDSPHYESCPRCGKESFYVATDSSAFCDNCGHASMNIEEPSDTESEEEVSEPEEEALELEEETIEEEPLGLEDEAKEEEPLPPSDEPSDDISLDLPEDEIEGEFEYEIVQYEKCPECGERSFHCVTNDSGFCEECDYIATGFEEELDFGITESVSPDSDAPDNELKVDNQIEEDVAQSTDKTPSPKSESPIREPDLKTVKSPGYEECPECGKGSLYVTTDASAFCDNCGYASGDVERDHKDNQNS